MMQSGRVYSDSYFFRFRQSVETSIPRIRAASSCVVVRANTRRMCWRSISSSVQSSQFLVHFRQPLEGVSVLGKMALCGAVGVALLYAGRAGRSGRLMRKEAIAVVALSWLMASVLGAFPFWLSGAAMGRDDAGRPIRIGVFQGLFESASGFSGTGATIVTDLEDPELMPRPILFWRSETHFLGGLGIMVLFVAVLGLGSAGKALMRTEITGPQQESLHARTQRAAMIFASIFIGMNVVLTLLLLLQDMSPFDALCHAFGTIATGGVRTDKKNN